MFEFLTGKALQASEAVAETVAAGAGVDGLSFTTENIGEALLCSGAGMVGIFIVVGIIIGSVGILNKVGNSKKQK